MNKSPQSIKPTYLIFLAPHSTSTSTRRSPFSAISTRLSPHRMTTPMDSNRNFHRFTYNFRWRSLIKRFRCVRNAVQMTYSQHTLHQKRKPNEQANRRPTDRRPNQPKHTHSLNNLHTLNDYDDDGDWCAAIPIV